MQKRMLPLKSLRPHLYGTRRLEAGDEYEAPVEEAIALVAMRKADFAKAKKKEPPPVMQPAPAPEGEPAVPVEAASEPVDHSVGAMMSDADINCLRQEAAQLGIDVDGRWGVARLRHEIEIAQAKR